MLVGYDTQLAEQRELVAEEPRLGDQPVGQAPHSHLEDLDGPAGRRDPEKLPGVDAVHRPDGPDAIVFRDDVFDRVHAAGDRLRVVAGTVFHAGDVGEGHETPAVVTHLWMHEPLALTERHRAQLKDDVNVGFLFRRVRPGVDLGEQR